MPKIEIMTEYTDKIKNIKYHRVFFDEVTGDFDIQRVECQHQYHKVKRSIRGGGIHIMEQCKKCGDFKGQPLSQKNEKMWKIPEAIKEQDCGEDCKIERERLTERLEAGRQKIRDAYYESPEWKEKHKLVMARDEGKCQACQDKPAVQAHHLTYRHFKNEPLFDLIAVCVECHASIHKMEKGEDYEPIKHD